MIFRNGIPSKLVYLMSVTPSANVITRLSALVADARGRARTRGCSVVASVVEPVNPLDPLEVLESLSQSDAVGAADEAERMYWSRPDEDFALAGFGSAVTLQPAGSERFTTVDTEWEALRENARVDDPSGGARGAGLALMGGFAFSAEGARSKQWRDFPAARMIVPRVQVASCRDAHWLTLNLVVQPNGDTDVSLDALNQLRDCVLTASGAGRRSGAGSTRPRIAATDIRTRKQWQRAIHAALDAIRDGELEKVVLARDVRGSAPNGFDVADVVRQLRSAHEASYVFACWSGDSAFVGASPELLVRVADGDVLSSSLAGSAARGATPEADEKLARELFDSAKERREHEVVRISLCRALEQFCDDVTSSDTPSLLALPQVQHLHTTVRAKLRPEHSVLDLVAGLHPTPAVAGEPRAAALRFIREQEGMDRGWYAGPVGWLHGNGGEFAVALRSALITGHEAILFAGCGIVADSHPDAEYAESQLKLRPMELALSAAASARDAPSVPATAGGCAR